MFCIQYALAQWQNAAGVPENRILLFPMKGQHLVGVFFPNAGGVPELPKASICGLPTAGMPAAMLAFLARLSEPQQRALAGIPLPQRMEALKTLLTRWANANAGAMAGGSGNGGPGGGPGVP